MLILAAVLVKNSVLFCPRWGTASTFSLTWFHLLWSYTSYLSASKSRGWGGWGGRCHLPQELTCRCTSCFVHSWSGWKPCWEILLPLLIRYDKFLSSFFCLNLSADLSPNASYPGYVPSKNCFTPVHLRGKRGTPQVAEPYCCCFSNIFTLQDPRDCHRKLPGHIQFYDPSPGAFWQNAHRNGDRRTSSAQHLRLPWKPLQKSRDESYVNTWQTK